MAGTATVQTRALTTTPVPTPTPATPPTPPPQTPTPAIALATNTAQTMTLIQIRIMEATVAQDLGPILTHMVPIPQIQAMTVTLTTVRGTGTPHTTLRTLDLGIIVIRVQEEARSKMVKITKD